MPAPLVPDKGQSPEHVAWFRDAMLEWYDRNRRILPWRALPGRQADPYHVWLSEIMLQQTTVQAVIPYFLKFIETWPRLYDLAAAPEEDIMKAWAGLGYYSRARNLHRCARLLAGMPAFPSELNDLKRLPGVGDYTAAAIRSIGFDRPAAVVDGNVERVLARYYAIKEPLPEAKKVIRQYAENLSEGQGHRPGDFAQAMMDLGATICTPRSPRCPFCPLSSHCQARKEDIQESLPKRAQKQEKPKKTGYVYWITDGHGRILVHRRPSRGLLGGMLALPVSDWADEKNASTLTHPEFIVSSGSHVLKQSDIHIKHVFTHFELMLCIVPVKWGLEDLPYGFFWVEKSGVEKIGMPSLFTKVMRMVTAAE